MSWMIPASPAQQLKLLDRLNPQAPVFAKIHTKRQSAVMCPACLIIKLRCSFALSNGKYDPSACLWVNHPAWTGKVKITDIDQLRFILIRDKGKVQPIKGADPIETSTSAPGPIGLMKNEIFVRTISIRSQRKEYRQLPYRTKIGKLVHVSLIKGPLYDQFSRSVDV